MMENDDDKPNPDELLRAIQTEEKKKTFGHLKIFFGMSAGVGKTYAMLEEAQSKLKAGVNLVVGTVNTHGRKETEALLQGLPIIPEKWIRYKDILFEEMDLEAIIAAKPELVLVDELAHTNVPGSKHPKRWQDVIEIIDSGIDVYTTLNVQHIESRKDIVEQLTEIQVRETVPDLILERANSIELIDLPPHELLQRLREGKVYLGEQSKIATENFFQEENLTALREISLRFTAEKVDHDLHGILHIKGWKTRERLMVAVSPSPTSEQLIRASRRISFELDAPWVVVYVDRGVQLSDQAQARLNRHFNLARELGAEVVTTYDLDIAVALQRVARQKDITRIVIGRSPKKSFWNLFQKSFIDRLESENKNIDLIILRQEMPVESFQHKLPQFPVKWKEYGVTLVFIAGITILGSFMGPVIGYKSVGFIFLLGILVLSFFVGRKPIFLAAILSAIFWNFLFIPPIYTPTISDPEDITLVIVYFCVAVISGALTTRLREQDEFLHQREENIEKLYDIERDIANSTNLQSLRSNISSRLENSFAGWFDILIKGPNNQLIFDSQLPLLNDEKERSVATWVFQSGKVAGWSTDTLPSVEGIYFPIKFSKSVVGVLVYYPKREHSLSLQEINFIQTVNQQLGIYLERIIMEEAANKEIYSKQIERMHQSIFHSLKRSFYTPLEGIVKINQKITRKSADPEIRSLASQMEQFIFNIKLTVDNIIAISELESGFVHFNRKKNSIKALIEQNLKDLEPLKNDHVINLTLPEEPLFLPFDFNLLSHALKNLLINAFEYSEGKKSVSIKLEVLEKTFRLSVLDEGPGIPEEILPLIFDKFYHAPGSKKELGLGLGLAIVKAVVDIHQGKIEVKPREVQGTEFSLIMPM